MELDMDLRITSQTLVEQTLASVRRQFSLMARLQEEATTGKKLLRPSDAPADNNILLASRAQQARLDTNLETSEMPGTLLDVSVSALRESGNILASARDLAIEGSHAANDQNVLRGHGAASRCDDQSHAGHGHTEFNGQFLFGGTSSRTAPFSVTGTDNHGRPQVVTYNGSPDTGSVLMGQQAPIPTLYPGSRVFQLRERGTTLYTGDTGATAGSGLDSATDKGTLIVRHTGTTYAAGSGVQAGTGIGSWRYDYWTRRCTSPFNQRHQRDWFERNRVTQRRAPRQISAIADTNLKVSGPER